MANSTTNLDTISESQSGKATAANAVFDAASPATLYGRRASTCSGLTWGYYGGHVRAAGVDTLIANGTHTLAASTTTYMEADPATGTVSWNTSGFTAGRIPLYTIVAGASTVSSYTDHRSPVLQAGYANAGQAAVSGTPGGTDAAIIADLITLTNALRSALVSAGIIKGSA